MTAWHAFDYDDKKATAPSPGELVWVYEDCYLEDVSLGVFDGVTFRMWHGDDDCSITHWRHISYPAPPPLPSEPR